MSASHVPLIDLTGICRSYRSGDVVTRALRGVELSIDSGEFVAIVGAAGSGKSTLMNIIGLIDRPTQGVYRFAGQDVAGLDRDGLAALRRNSFGFIFQQYHLISTVSALGNVEMPARPAPIVIAARPHCWRGSALPRACSIGRRSSRAASSSVSRSRAR